MDNQPAVSGCILTFCVWLFAGLIMLGPVLGTCVAEQGQTCPSDLDRNLSILTIAVAAASVNAALIFLLYRGHYRDKP